MVLALFPVRLVMLCHTNENPGALMCESHHPLYLETSPLLCFRSLCYLVLFCSIPLSREFMKSKHFLLKTGIPY